MSDLGTYDPSEVAVIVGGVSLSGFGPDTMVNVEREVETFNKVVGSGGEVARRKSSNRSGTITVTLLQTASDNATMSALAAIDEASAAGTFPVIVKDASGLTVCSAQNCWISSYPAVAFSGELEVREWVLHADAINMILGGNV